MNLSWWLSRSDWQKASLYVAHYLTFSCLYMYMVLNCCISFWLGSFFMSWSISSAMCFGRMESSRRSCGGQRYMWRNSSLQVSPLLHVEPFRLPLIVITPHLHLFTTHKQTWTRTEGKHEVVKSTVGLLASHCCSITSQWMGTVTSLWTWQYFSPITWHFHTHADTSTWQKQKILLHFPWKKTKRHSCLLHHWK